MNHQQMNSIFQTKVFKTHKQSEKIEDCQDAYSKNEQNMRFAIADGASRSFFPFQWAQILVDYFCNDETAINKTILDHKNWIEWIGPPQAQWKKEIGEKLSTTTKYYIKNRWITKDPGVSTFVGIQFNIDQQVINWDAMIVGDSCLFHYNQTTFNSYLIKSSDDFDSHPEYFATYAKNNEYSPEFIQERADNNDYFILASDALAKWILSFKENRNVHFTELMDHIISIQSEEAFNKFINEIRKNEDLRLENDDVTLMIIHVQLPQKKINNPNEKKKKTTIDKKIIKKNEIVSMENEAIIRVNKKAFEQLINKIEKKTKRHTFFIRLSLFLHIISLPVMFFIIYELSNIYFDKIAINEPMQEIEEKLDIPLIPAEEIETESSIYEQSSPKDYTNVNHFKKPQEKIILSRNTALYNENGKLITHTLNPIEVICLQNCHKPNSQKRKIQLTLWVIKEVTNKQYSKEDNDMIQIINNVNARKRKTFNDEDRIMTLDKGTTYQKRSKETDQDNNQWYKINTVLYIQ